MSQVCIINPNGTATFRDETPAEATARLQREAVQDAVRAANTNNQDRIRALGTAAAKHAKNIANPALTTRQTMELLARLALAETADDQ
jgi:hypothetical protein